MEQGLLDSARQRDRQPAPVQDAFIGASARGERRARNGLLGAAAAAVVSLASSALGVHVFSMPLMAFWQVALFAVWAAEARAARTRSRRHRLACFHQLGGSCLVYFGASRLGTSSDATLPAVVLIVLGVGAITQTFLDGHALARSLVFLRPMPAATPLAIMLTMPILVHTGLEVAVLFSVTRLSALERDPSDLSGNVGWWVDALFATLMGSVIVAPAYLVAWHSLVRGRFTTLLLRRFNDPLAARYTRLLTVILGGIGGTTLLRDRAFDAAPASRDLAMDVHLPDEERVLPSDDDDWFEMVMHLASGADAAAMVISEELTENLKAELEFCVCLLGASRVLLIVPASRLACVRYGVASLGIPKPIIVEVSDAKPLFGIRLRFALLVALARMRRRERLLLTDTMMIPCADR